MLKTQFSSKVDYLVTELFNVREIEWDEYINISRESMWRLLKRYYVHPVIAT